MTTTVTLGTALSYLVDCTVSIDAVGTVLHADDAITALLGHEPAELLGTLVWDYLHPEDLPGAAEVFARELEDPGHREANPTVRVRDASGRWRYCEIVCGAFRLEDDGSILLGLRWIGHDEDSGPLAQGLRDLSGPAGFDSRYDCIIIVAPDATVRAIEDRITSLLGYEPSSLLGNSILPYVHPGDLDRAVRAFEAEVANPANRGDTPVVRLLHADGTWRRCEAPGRNRISDPALGGVVIGLRYVGPSAERAASGRVSPRQWSALTAAEQDVVTAVSCGLSNKQIAHDRGKSVRTVEAQLSTIYRKLGIESRAQLVAEAHAR